MVSSSLLFATKPVDLIDDLLKWKEVWEARPCSLFVASSVEEEVWVDAAS